MKALLLLVVLGFAGLTESAEPNYPNGINLYDNTWYTVTLKAGGVLTWSYTKVEDKYNHVQIVSGDALAEFTKGAKYYNDTLWRLSESEVYGYVVFINRAQPKAVLTWAGTSNSGHYVVLYLDGLGPDYLPGGKYRDDCLWKIVPEKGSSDSFLIYNKRFPNNGIMTWAVKEAGEGKKFMQIYNTGTPEVHEHDKDYLWEFKEARSSYLQPRPKDNSD